MYCPQENLTVVQLLVRFEGAGTREFVVNMDGVRQATARECATSGNDDPSEVKRAFELGVHGYFAKPTGRTELQELMKMIFHNWATSRVPPVKEFQMTAAGEEAVLKKEQG